jgi:hypothetical protein
LTHSNTSAAPLSVEQLEAGLRILDADEVDLTAFWDENIGAFRRTVLVAILETSAALLSPSISLRSRVELENQLDDLVQYIELADRYMARRLLTRGPLDSRRSSWEPRIH